MARRRRTFVLRYFSSFTYLSDLVCFKERTSFIVLKLAQSCRRRFTESTFGVSLLTSEADPFSVFHRKLFSLPPSSSTGSSSDPSELTSNKESIDLVDNDHGSSQIRRVCSPTSTFFLFFLGRELFSVYIRRSIPPLVCVTGSHTVVTLLRVSAPSSSRRRLHSHSSDVGFQELLFFWAWPIDSSPKGLDISFSLVGSIDNWPNWSSYLVWPINLMVTHLSRCFTPEDSRCCNHLRLAPPSLMVSLPPKIVPVVTPIKESPPLPSSLFHPLSARYESDPNLRLRLTHQATPLPLSQLSSCQVQGRPTSLSSYLKEVIISLLRFSMRVDVFSLGYLSLLSPPRYQNSSCRGQRENVFTILLLEGENSSTIILVFMALVCCACVARSGLELEGDSSETLLSDIVKGSAKVAVSMIVIPVLAAGSIVNNRSLCVLFVSQGIVSLTSSKIVKVRRLPDDIYGLSVKIACIYPVIFHICVFRLPFEAAMILLSFVVTNYSFNGDY